MKRGEVGEKDRKEEWWKGRAEGERAERNFSRQFAREDNGVPSGIYSREPIIRETDGGFLSSPRYG